MSNYINRVINKFLIIEDGYKLEITKRISDMHNNDNFFLNELSLLELKSMKEQYNKELKDDKYLILKNRIIEKDFEVFSVKNTQGEMLGYFCMAYKSIKENGINYVIKVDEESVYLFDDYVFIKHRGKGVQYYSIISRLMMAVNKNKKYGIVNVYSWNKNSIKNYTNLGFKKYITYYYFKIIRKIIIKNNNIL